MSRRLPHALGTALVGATLLALTACGATSAPDPAAVATSMPSTAPAGAPQASRAQADLSGIKQYLVDKTGVLRGHTGELKAISDRYYAMAQQANFDYATLWATRRDEVVATVEEARAAWVLASPSYERVEGIVAGVPTLAAYDIMLDAGASAKEDPEGAAPYDLTLPDGRVLARPGNLFGVSEATLWATDPEYTIGGVPADFDADGAVEFGEALPDANVLKAAADTLDRYTGELVDAAVAWQPTEADAFTALVTMVPTMNEYFDSWKNSRFVAGEQATQRDFVAISRLADIQDILGSLEVVHAGVSPLISEVDVAQDAAIGQGLRDLKLFVADVHAKEQGGQRFSPEDADTLGAEAQNRATAITGQVAQVAARLQIPIEQ